MRWILCDHGIVMNWSSMPHIYIYIRITACEILCTLNFSIIDSTLQNVSYIQYFLFIQIIHVNKNNPRKNSLDDDIWSLSPYLCSLELPKSTKNMEKVKTCVGITSLARLHKEIS